MTLPAYPYHGPHQASMISRSNPRIIADQEPLVFGSGDTVKSFVSYDIGAVFFALVETGNWIPTATLSIENQNGDEIYSKSALVGSSTKTKINVCSDGNDVPLVGLSTIKLTLTGAPGGSGGTAKITLYVI